MKVLQDGRRLSTRWNVIKEFYWFFLNIFIELYLLRARFVSRCTLGHAVLRLVFKPQSEPFFCLPCDVPLILYREEGHVSIQDLCMFFRFRVNVFQSWQLLHRILHLIHELLLNLFQNCKLSQLHPWLLSCLYLCI